MCNQRFTGADGYSKTGHLKMGAGKAPGGVAQGIGQAMIEQAANDETRQLVSGSCMEYAMPRTDDVLMIMVEHCNAMPSTHNTLRVTGCGEAGAMGSTPALMQR
jgi:carbon-monoxide dehydrogenase large subunit